MDSIININKFFHPSEVLLGSELWDKLSGCENTMEELLKIINSISNPDFMNNYEYLNLYQNRYTAKYKEILKQWFLYSELELLEYDDEIKKACETNKRLKKKLQMSPFSDGIYKNRRYNSLSEVFK